MTLSLYDAVRLEIGDNVNGTGILPNGAGFSDEEIDYAASSEGVTSPNETPSAVDVGRTSARLLEIASTQWASRPETVELGPASETQRIASSLRAKAAEFRDRWGFGSTTSVKKAVQNVPSYVGVGSAYTTPNQ